MTHATDPQFSDEYNVPSAEAFGIVPSSDAPPMNATPAKPAAPVFEQEAEDSFRIAATSNLEELRGFYEAGSEAYETFAHAIRASFEEFATGIGQLNAKLMEFGQANAQSNLEFVTNAAGIRSVRDAVDLQAGYVRGQYAATSAQLQELQALTAAIAEKAASPFQQQFARYTQMFRSC
jgi:hypothetical protein